MNTTTPVPLRLRGWRLFPGARALLAVSALAALAVTTRSFAQAPTFNTLVTTYKGGQGFAHPGGAAVGDFNGDGKLDSAIFDGSGTIHVLLGNGDGTFAVHDVNVPLITAGNAVGLQAQFVPYLPHPIDGVIRAIRAADVNGDGKLDIVCLFVVHINFAPLWGTTVLINGGNDVSGAPQFTTATHYFSPAADLRSLTIGDLNGDGRPDFIAGAAYGALEVYLNDGSGAYTLNNSTTIQPNVGGAVGFGAIADLNGDGKADFVVTDGQASATDIFFGNGDGTFQAPAVISNSAGSIAVADLNKDGKPDFVEAYADGSVAVFLNNGNGTFGSPTLYLPWIGGVASALAIADINGDGNLDLVATNGAASNGTNGVAVLPGNGDGTFGAATLYHTNQLPVDLAVVDFNGDGKPDIGMVGYNDDTYGVLTNTTPAPLPTQTLTILGGNGSFGAIAANVEYYNPVTAQWQPSYLVGQHPWGEVPGTNSWINYKPSINSDPGAGPSNSSTLWYLYRVRFTVPTDAVNPKMTFSVKADNYAQVAINGVATGGTAIVINNTLMNNVIEGQADQLNADAVVSQSVHTGENTITLNVGDYGGLNGFNFRIDLSMQSSQSLQIVPTAQPPVVTSATVNQGYGTAFSYTISATNSPTSYGATNLPAGLTLSGNTISGTLPNTVATFTIGLSASNTGGTGTGTLTLNVTDSVPPVITAPASLTAEATGPGGAVVNFTATASDAISGNASVTATPASGSTFPLGVTGVSLTATDAAGNTAKQTLVVQVQDTTPPTITAPANITAEATGASGAVVTFSASASDLVDGAVSVSASPASGSTFAIGSTTVTLTATDARRNTATKTFTVTVQDTTPPVITIPANITAEATSAAGAAVTFSTSASDIVDGAVSTTAMPASGSTFPLGTTIVTVTATDAHHNTATKTFTVTVQDTTPPAITSVPANIVAEATSASGAVVTYAAATATDAVGVTSLTYSQKSGTTFPIGTTTVIVTAKDAAGNASSASFTVTVRDTTAPVIATVTPSSATLWPPNHQMVAITVSAAASDNTGVASLKIISVTSSEPDNGLGDGDTPNDIQITGNLTVNLRAERSGTGNGRTYTITVEARDAYGNASTKTCTVFVPKSQGGK